MGNKAIRFIDSQYNDLFYIPDGWSIVVKYPDGHTETKKCKYIDDYHTEINGNCFHICQWAEIMERENCTYESAEKYILQQVKASEFEFMYTSIDDKDRGCIGYLRADFDGGDSFYHTWWDGNTELKTDEFKAEFDKVINYFRIPGETPLLKSSTDMYRVCCDLKATPSEFNHEIRGFKVETEKHTYYLRCNPRRGDYNLYCYCYDNTELLKYKNMKLVKANSLEASKDKLFKTENGVREVYYNPDSSAGGQLVYNEFSFELIKEAYNACSNNQEAFFNYLQENCKQYLIDVDYPDFNNYFEEFVQTKADFEGYSAKTMKGLLIYAEITPEKSPKKSEPER